MYLGSNIVIVTQRNITLHSNINLQKSPTNISQFSDSVTSCQSQYLDLYIYIKLLEYFLWTSNVWPICTVFSCCRIFLPWPDISRAMVLWPHCWRVIDTHFIEQTRTNMSQPGQRPGTAVGDEQHVLQLWWSRKDI